MNMGHYTPDKLKEEFNRKFAYLMDSFMNKWGEYIEDTYVLDQLIEAAFDEWVKESGWFEQ